MRHLRKFTFTLTAGLTLAAALSASAAQAVQPGSAMGDCSAQVGPSIAADPAAPPAEQLKKSFQTWETLKSKCGGNYSYTVLVVTTGPCFQTRIVVRNNKVVERTYNEFPSWAKQPPLEPGKEPANPSSRNFIEKGEQLGVHKYGESPKTLDDLYKEAKNVVETKLTPSQELRFQLDKQGLLRSCYYIDYKLGPHARATGVQLEDLQLDMPKN